jgi:hypothetical protein
MWEPPASTSAHEIEIVMKKKRALGNRQDITLCGPVIHNQRGHLIFGAYTGMLEPDGRKQIVSFATGTADLAQALVEAEKFLQKLREQWDCAYAHASRPRQNSSADGGAKSSSSPVPDNKDKSNPVKVGPHRPSGYALWPELEPWLEQHKPQSPDVWIFPELVFSSGKNGPESKP